MRRAPNLSANVRMMECAKRDHRDIYGEGMAEPVSAESPRWVQPARGCKAEGRPSASRPPSTNRTSGSRTSQGEIDLTIRRPSAPMVARPRRSCQPHGQLGPQDGVGDFRLCALQKGVAGRGSIPPHGRRTPVLPGTSSDPVDSDHGADIAARHARQRSIRRSSGSEILGMISTSRISKASSRPISSAVATSSTRAWNSACHERGVVGDQDRRGHRLRSATSSRPRLNTAE